MKRVWPVIPIESFLERYIPVPESGCWIWDMGLNPQTGYGTFRHKYKTYSAHRFFYSKLVGPIPEGLHICHKCDTRCCVNPDHLFAATLQENIADMMRKGRSSRGSKCGGVKLTIEEVRQIRDLSGHMRQQDIADAYGVSRTEISCIKNGKRWETHV